MTAGDGAGDDLESLIAGGTVRLVPDGLLSEPAPFAGLVLDPDRLRGMLLGLAIGDALGNSTESLLPGKRRQQHGEVRDYLWNRHLGAARGTPSDDTQLAFWLLEHLTAHGAVKPDAWAERIATGGHIFGIGKNTRAFIKAWKATGDWRRAAQDSVGNGALMRVAPVILPHVRTGGPGLWADAALASAVTHNSAASTAACVAFAGLLAELLVTSAPPGPGWWVDAWVARARPLEGETGPHRPRGGALADTPPGPLWRFVADHVPPRIGMPVEAAGDVWWSGAHLFETMPCVLHILARHGHDPEEAILRAVNETKDNDTIAAIVGAAVGALHGASALPRRWRDGLTGRVVADRAAEDGRVQAMIGQALERWAA
jgi:ADP-ribosyl-[dinitrogen reductase] hydrolase